MAFARSNCKSNKRTAQDDSEAEAVVEFVDDDFNPLLANMIATGYMDAGPYGLELITDGDFPDATNWDNSSKFSILHPFRTTTLSRIVSFIVTFSPRYTLPMYLLSPSSFTSPFLIT